MDELAIDTSQTNGSTYKGCKGGYQRKITLHVDCDNLSQGDIVGNFDSNDLFFNFRKVNSCRVYV